MKLFRALRGDDAQKTPTTAKRGVDEKEARAVLRKGCAQGQKIVLMTNHIGRVAQGRLRLVEGDALFVELLDPVFRAEFRPLGLCCGMLNWETRAWSFLTNVRSQTVVGGRPMVSLQMPEHMTSMHGRTCFRIPLSEDSPVTAIAIVEGVHHAVSLIDISLGGMGFTMPAGSPSPAEDDELTAQITYTGDEPDDVEDDAGTDEPATSGDGSQEPHDLPETNWSEPVTVPSVVRHATDDHVGIYFKCAVKNGQLDPPRPLRRLVKALEAHWLRSRVR